ncbi:MULTISPECIES: HEPN domain-containing protein [unclassified Microbacterium]|uniref:ApeA N-terminal domain 1-containing protein n=1 Tax=unclassified Microbacterium TaxID=2609290 RepID=UPI003017EBE4
MTETQLSEPNDWTGHWWLPEEPDKKVPGVLSFKPESGLRLRLIGGWDYHVTRPGLNGSTIVTNEVKSWPMVHGYGGNKPVTLLNASLATARGGLFGEPDTLEVRASTALVGALMETPDEAAFVAGVGDIEDLTVWSRRSGVESRVQFGAQSGETMGEIELRRLSPLTATAGPLSVKLSHYAWYPFSEDSRSQRVTRVRESQVIRFEREDPQPLEYWVDLLSSTADLMSLSTLRACGIVSMRVYVPPTPDQWPETHPMRDQPNEVTIYMERIVKPRPDDDALPFRNYVLTLADLPFEELMPRWLEIRDKFAAARSMILGLRYVRNGYVETRLVTAVAAAESMHRALTPAPPIPPVEFKALRRTLLDAVAPERKAWLADRLTEHSNVPTLKQRLLDLVGRVGDAGHRLVHNPEVWAKAAKDGRNLLAHTGSASNDLEHLHAVTEVTASVVILNLLYELGVSQEVLSKAVDEHPVLSHAAHLARRVLCDDDSVVMQIAVQSKIAGEPSPSETEPPNEAAAEAAAGDDTPPNDAM